MEKIILKIIKILSSNYSIALILALGFILRIIFINEVPLGLSNDELIFIINAKAIALTGSDISGIWNPWSLKPIYNSFPMSELSFLIVSPLLGLFKSTLLIAKLPYILFSTLLISVLYSITIRFFSKKQALIVSLVTAISPWGIFFGRTAFDFPLAIFFYMLALSILLYTKGWRILISFIPLFLAFYCYIGTKIIFLPFAIFVSFFSWYFLNNKKYSRYYFLLILACMSLFIFFITTLNSGNTGKRLAEINSPASKIISDKVNFERKLSIDSPINAIFINKYTVFGREFLNNYLGIFSPQHQFIKGDSEMHLSLWYHGYFYYLDIIFIFFGLSYLYFKDRKVLFLTAGLILIAPLPAAFTFNQAGYIHRGSLIFPLLLIVIGLGIHYSISLVKLPIFKKLAIATITILYFLLFIHLLIIYFLRYPIYNSEGSNFSSRVLSMYIVLAKTQNKYVYVHSPEPDAIFKGYLFYSNSYNKKSTKEVSGNFINTSYKLNNVRFLKSCPSKKEYNSGKNIIIVHGIMQCKNINEYQGLEKPIEIVQLSDAGTMYFIYKDGVCNNYTLPRYSNNLSLFDFNIESLSVRNFCTKFIIYKK